MSYSYLRSMVEFIEEHVHVGSVKDVLSRHLMLSWWRLVPCLAVVDQRLGGWSVDDYLCYHSPGTVYTLPGRLCCDEPPPFIEAALAYS